VGQSNKPELNCSICNEPIPIEIAKTDDSGQAVHEQCYVLKLGVESSRASIQQAERETPADVARR
jgi:hypothetical protein